LGGCLLTVAYRVQLHGWEGRLEQVGHLQPRCSSWRETGQTRSWVARNQPRSPVGRRRSTMQGRGQGCSHRKGDWVSSACFYAGNLGDRKLSVFISGFQPGTYGSTLTCLRAGLLGADRVLARHIVLAAVEADGALAVTRKSWGQRLPGCAQPWRPWCFPRDGRILTT
jgi:hypothetical protein